MKIALFQAAPCHDLERCLQRLDDALAEAAGAGAGLLVTPEMWLGGYNIAPETLQAHAEAYDRLSSEIAASVARHKVALILGCALPCKQAPLNAAVAFDETGREVARYAKCHLFGDVDAQRFTPGASLSPVITLAGIKLALAICYDIEFPETARHLALEGAELIVVPTANMEPYESVNERLVPARAEENGVYVAYTNLTGQEGKLSYCGLSCVADPTGETLASGGAEPGLVYAEIDPARVKETQETRPFLRDRRREIY